jgi:hypothetical protein
MSNHLMMRSYFTPHNKIYHNNPVFKNYNTVSRKQVALYMLNIFNWTIIFYTIKKIIKYPPGQMSDHKEKTN